MAMKSRLIIVILYLLVGCRPGSTARKDTGVRLAELVHQYRKDESMAKLRSILVVTEESCPACNKSLALLVEHYLEDSTALVWVSATGTMVDIGPFRAEPGRVVWDYGDSLQALGIIKGSGAIFLKEGRVDTVIQLEARNLKNALAAVSGRMEDRAK